MKNKTIAMMTHIAANMEDAARDMIQQAIRIAEAGTGRVSRTTCLGAWQDRKSVV